MKDDLNIPVYMFMYVCVKAIKYFEAYKLCRGLRAISDSCHRHLFEGV